MLEFGPLWCRQSPISPLSQTQGIFSSLDLLRLWALTRIHLTENYSTGSSSHVSDAAEVPKTVCHGHWLTDLLYLWLQESTLKHPFMTDDYSPDDVTARVGGPVYKPITNSNLLAMLSDDRTTNGLVMPEARCKWSALWKAASGARCHWQSAEADDRKSDSASQE